MRSDRIIAFVMAGGRGSRLKPLTAARSKPSVPFGARYRIVDFVLSNLVNSQVRTIYLLVQYKSQSLIEHVRKGWTISPLMQEQFVTVVPPRMRVGENWFQGTADAVRQNISLIEEHGPGLVAVFGADHICRMDIRQMIDFHKERNADVTVVALPVSLEDSKSFGVIAADPNGRIQEFQEKPDDPTPMPGSADRALASMGNYLFNTSALLEALEETRKRGESDFGSHVLPRLLKSHRLFAYGFATNATPNIKDYEQPACWRDVGTIDVYFDAHKDLLGADPLFDMFNPHWPVYASSYQGPGAQVLGGEVRNSLLGSATVIHDKVRISNSIIRREAVIEEDVELDDCIIMDYVRICKGARLRRVIVDRHNRIAAGERIGFDAAADRRRFTVTESGIRVVPGGKVSYFARDSREGAGSSYAE